MNSRDPQQPSRSEIPEMPPALRDWLGNQPPEERRKLKRSWTLAGLAESLPDSEVTEATWEGVAGTLWGEPGQRPANDRRAAARSPARSRSGVSRVKRWAVALVAIALLAGAGLWLWLRPVTITASAGTTKTVELPDGSRAMLNSGSSLTYRRSFPLWGWNRHVRLEGEALFEVEKGEETFTTATFNARAEVLGTRFNMRARREAGMPAMTPVTTVTLAAGALRLFGEGGKQTPVTLAPGQESRVTGRGGVPTPPAPADLRMALAWRRGALAFPRSQVGAILDELERRFAVEIRAPQALRLDSLSFYLSGTPDPAAVLADLCAVQGCTYRRASDGVFVVE